MLLPFLFFSFYKKEYAKYFCALFIIHAKSMRYKENVERLTERIGENEGGRVSPGACHPLIGDEREGAGSMGSTEAVRRIKV